MPTSHLSGLTYEYRAQLVTGILAPEGGPGTYWMLGKFSARQQLTTLTCRYHD